MTLPAQTMASKGSVTPCARQVEVGQVADEPARPGVVLLCGGDQHRVDVHADDLVTDVVQVSADPARPAAGVEHPRAAREHRVDQPGLPDEVHPLVGEVRNRWM